MSQLRDLLLNGEWVANASMPEREDRPDRAALTLKAQLDGGATLVFTEPQLRRLRDIIVPPDELQRQITLAATEAVARALGGRLRGTVDG